MDKELLDILVCPVCHEPPELKPDPEELCCNTCRKIYPVRDGVPMMIPEEALDME